MSNALDGHDKDGVFDGLDHSIVADPDAERIVAPDELAAPFWSRVARQFVDRPHDTTLNGGIESA